MHNNRAVPWKPGQRSLSGHSLNHVPGPCTRGPALEPLGQVGVSEDWADADSRLTLQVFLGTPVPKHHSLKCLASSCRETPAPLYSHLCRPHCFPRGTAACSGVQRWWNTSGGPTWAVHIPAECAEIGIGSQVITPWLLVCLCEQSCCLLINCYHTPWLVIHFYLTRADLKEFSKKEENWAEWPPALEKSALSRKWLCPVTREFIWSIVKVVAADGRERAWRVAGFCMPLKKHFHTHVE